MEFCTEADIKADFKGLEVTATSAVTTASLAEIILQESNYIRARLGLRYQMEVFDLVVPDPVTTYPQALSILKRIAIFRVSERVRNVIEVKTNATQKSSEEKYTKNQVRTPNDDLTAIADGTLILKDVPGIGDGGLISVCAGKCSPGKSASGNIFNPRKQQW